MPLSFYLSGLALVSLAWMGWEARWKGWGIPMGMVVGTIGVWYFGDVFYNDYQSYVNEFGERTLGLVWWQVFGFLVAFALFVPNLHRLFNYRLLRRQSQAMTYVEKQGYRDRFVQQRLDIVSKGVFFAWALLAIVSLIRVNGNVVGLFAPYLGKKVDPWARGQIGGGFSALISLAGYLQLFLVASAGVIAALARNPKTQRLALLICFLAFPGYIFDRTRNTMLAVTIPGVLAFVLVRLRLGWMGKLGLLGVFFLIVNAWMKVVANTREGMSFDIESASAKFADDEDDGEHAGLNMFEELAWIEVLTKTGKYAPKIGDRYFSEMVNPIPRALWKEKPTIGLDYAIARGQAVVGPGGQTTATISTGMIGQGVVNFGPFFGPIAAAFLIAIWVVILARQDLLGRDPGRIILYGCGLILTFNLGRDITLLTIYPFLFGLLAYQVWQRQMGGGGGSPMPVRGSRTRRRASLAGGSNTESDSIQRHLK